MGDRYFALTSRYSFALTSRYSFAIHILILSGTFNGKRKSDKLAFLSDIWNFKATLDFVTDGKISLPR